MDADSIRAALTSVAGQLGEIGVRALSIFGSAARNELSPSSDLDFLVEFDGMATFDRYMAVRELLEATFGMDIDLVTVRALKPNIREHILAEAIKVA